MINKLTAKEVLNVVAPMVLRLSEEDWFTSKISACGLYGSVLSRLEDHHESDKELVCKLTSSFFKFAQDDTPMVRRACGSALGEVAVALSGTADEGVGSYFSILSSDAQESVRLTTIEQIATIISGLSQAQLDQHHTLDMVKSFITDRSWRIRYAMAQRFPALIDVIQDSTQHEPLLDLFSELLRDPEGEVRSVAVEQIIRLLDVVSDDKLHNMILPIIVELVSIDVQPTVRRILAETTIHPAFLKRLGVAHVKSDVLPMWEMLLKNDIIGMPEVRLHGKFMFVFNLCEDDFVAAF